MSEKIRLGISTRITDAASYTEKRDSIAQDWTKLLSHEFKEFHWQLIPNLGVDVIQHIKNWDLNAFILTGGENIGTDKIRDCTENLLIDYSLNNNLPVVGICRGLQMIYTYLGGEIVQKDESFCQTHRAKLHNINFMGKTRMVNSYHNNMLADCTLDKNIEIVARCSVDDSIESILYNKMLGIMWHPERVNYENSKDILLLKTFLSHGSII